jgi:hypothetical protein
VKEKLKHIMVALLLLAVCSVARGMGDTTAVVMADTVPVLTQKDSAALAKMEKKLAKQKKKRDWSNWRPDPKRATLLAIIPGAGQIYNRKYWKLPIFYGGFLGCIYAWRWNNQMYSDYSQAYVDLCDGNPDTDSYNKFLHLGITIDENNADQYKGIFKSRKDKYRRWRDLSIFVMIGVYALSIIDAYVDASLSKFDISDDLSIEVKPAVINGSDNRLENSALGVHGALKF